MIRQAVCLPLALIAATVLLTAQAQPIAAPGTEGYQIIVADGDTDVIATYLGTTASYDDQLSLGGSFIFDNHTTPVGTSVDLGRFAAGTELVFALDVSNTGDVFYSGPGTRNADGLAHARVQADWQSSGVTLVSFEDLYGEPEGASGFNDLSFSFSNTTAAPVPEPAGWALMLAGLGLAGGTRRASRRACIPRIRVRVGFRPR